MACWKRRTPLAGAHPNCRRTKSGCALMDSTGVGTSAPDCLSRGQSRVGLRTREIKQFFCNTRRAGGRGSEPAEGGGDGASLVSGEDAAFVIDAKDQYGNHLETIETFRVEVFQVGGITKLYRFNKTMSVGLDEAFE
eukprot:1194465-Prorocentrum_minimum.AAC.1